VLTGPKSPVEPKYRFSGHETFPFRYAWLPKGIQGITKDPGLFSKEEPSIVTLGVGKNMVRAIKYWCEATGLLNAGSKGANPNITTLGRNLLGANGWDRYLEDVGTLWLLHWQLVSRLERASTWHLAFTRWGLQDFTGQQLSNWLLSIVPQESQISTNSLERDIEVFIRTYVPREIDANIPIEDTFDCPLVELGLIQEIPNQKVSAYRFVRGIKRLLPDEIFHYALIDYWNLNASSQKSISFETIFSGAGSPGAAFKLTEDDFCERLEKLPGWMGMSFDETVGMRQVFLKKEINSIDPLRALKKYYE